jgi:hypothetical protein
MVRKMLNLLKTLNWKCCFLAIGKRFIPAEVFRANPKFVAKIGNS